MPWETVVFILIGALAILSALGMVAMTNPVHSAIFLVICFIQIAGVFVMLGAEYLAVIQIIVYTGAVMVLLLFVIMLVDVDDLPEFHTAEPLTRAIGTLLGIMLLIEVAHCHRHPHDHWRAGQRDAGSRRSRRRQHTGHRPSALHAISAPLRADFHGV